MRRICILSSFALCAMISMTGCSTVDCGEAKKLDDETIQVTVTKSAGVFTTIVNGLGNAISPSTPQVTNLGNGVYQAAGDGVISAAEGEIIAQDAMPAAIQFINANSSIFCDSCPTTGHCQAHANGIKVKYLPPAQITSKPNGDKIIKMKFKILSGEVSCEKCPECEIVASVAATADVAPTACLSTQHIVVGEQSFSAPELANAMGLESGSHE